MAYTTAVLPYGHDCHWAGNPKRQSNCNRFKTTAADIYRLDTPPVTIQYCKISAENSKYRLQWSNQEIHPLDHISSNQPIHVMTYAGIIYDMSALYKHNNLKQDLSMVQTKQTTADSLLLVVKRHHLQYRNTTNNNLPSKVIFSVMFFVFMLSSWIATQT